MARKLEHRLTTAPQTSLGRILYNLLSIFEKYSEIICY